MPRPGSPPGAAAPTALEPLLDRIVAQGGEADGPAAALAIAAYRRASAEEFAQLDLDAVATNMLAAVEFIDARDPGTLALRVSNPPEEQATVVEVNVEDSPFLLSTIDEELNRLGLSTTDVVHPVLGVERTADGQLAEILPARSAARRESYILLQLDRRLPDDELDPVADALRAVLTDTLAATRDFHAMLARVGEVTADIHATAGRRYDDDEVAEAATLLDWLVDDHFVFLGYREYDIADHDGARCVMARPGSGLGILADEASSTYAQPVPLAEIAPELRERIEGGDLLLVSRTNRICTVHRQVRMIYVGLKKVDEAGRVSGEHRFLGLFAQKAYAEPASAIPVLRRKLAAILELEDIVDHSYDERAIRTLFESFPKHELFQADIDDLRRVLVRLLEARKRQDVRLMFRTDVLRRAVSALVAMPRERFNAAVRAAIQALLAERFNAGSVDYHLSLGESDQAILYFVIHIDGEVPEVDPDDLQAEVRAVTRTWEDDLRDALVRALGEREGRRLAGAYAGKLPPGYTDTNSPDVAVRDIGELEQLLSAGDETAIRVALQKGGRQDGAGTPMLRFKLYKLGAGVELSTFLPILESLGMTVVEEVPHRIIDLRPAGADPDADGWQVHVHDFGVRPKVGPVDIDRDGPRVSAAAQAIWQDQAEADSLNRLVLGAGLEWDDVGLLRAYRRYRRQLGTTFTEAYQNDALVEHPAVARGIVELFAARFDPAVRERGAVSDAQQRVDAALESVERHDHDRILRGFLGLIEATLRTNRYREDRSAALALKFHSAAVPDMAKPVPWAEVFVYSPLVEGIHLRGGPVARGGIRWSDRQEDFRTEVLGLMKAQVTKNAVIVPTGAKGGFVLKRPPADAPGLNAEVRRRYETYIRALLDITDNVVDGKAHTPPGIRTADGEDPYLVVAADKGTARFSDVANAISIEYGFWLGDAFASGGSQGYDHKAMGITARGAWVAVERHFRELDIDVREEPARVIGIGDMSGDVFGNGMLCSDRLQLVAAFDHRDIFIDPDPDPVASYAERERLFSLPGASWQDYDREVLSAGGGVWARTIKGITLSPQARSLLRLGVEEITPPDLIRAILRAPADLLFAGGIGTFIKASTETHADVGDRANDVIRVDADQVSTRMIGEGGNLAVTQRGRIQYARRGGRCNTDAIDNAAGVDTSDREVNIKILLRLAEERGELAPEDRADLLAAMTAEVGELVLRDMYLQTWAISQEADLSSGSMESYEQFMVALEEAGRLDRAVEVLPTSTETAERQESGAGLTRPELAVLVGYAKIDLAAHLLDSALPDDPALDAVLTEYFPPLIVERYGHLLPDHRLRRELVATIVANDLVNRMGITYVSRTASELGVDVADVTAAYWIARCVAESDEHWRAVERLDGRVPPLLQLELKGEVDRITDVFTRRYVRSGATADLTAAIDRDRPAFHELEKTVAEVGTPSRRADRQARVDRYLDLGVDAEVAERVAGLSELLFVPAVAEVARQAGQPVRYVADVFLRLTDGLPFEQLQNRLAGITPSGHWERWQYRGLTDELRDVRRAAAAEAVRAHPDCEPSEAVARFLSGRADARARVATLIEQLDREADVDLSAIAVAVRTLREVLRV